MTIIQQVEKIRIIKGMTQRELCRQAEITPSYYCRLLSEESHASEVILQHLVDAIGFSLAICLKSE